MTLPFGQTLDASVTRQMADWIVAFDGNAPEARIWARHVFLDWLSVTFAGAEETPVKLLRAAYRAPGVATLIGGGGQRRAEDAALINGTAGHVLDYDDASIMMNGHATAPVAPAIIAVAEEVRARGRDMLDAMIIAQEVECHLGQMLAPDHYQSGYHATTTIGTIGAAAAAARLFKLTPDQTAHALGLAATQAAGLKSMFGSMTKSFQVGKAAMNGIMAARLASLGFTANPDGLDCAQGMGPVMSTSFTTLPFAPGGMARWGVAFNAFKYHGACFFTHSAIEAGRELGTRTGLGPGDVAAMELDVSPAVLTMCDQPEPASGLETKFSIRHLAMAGLRGDPTGENACYSDSFANNPELVAARKRVKLNTPPDNSAMLVAARMRITTHDGAQHEAFCDVGELATDTEAQWQRLCGKTCAMLPDRQAKALIDLVANLDRTPSARGLIAQIRQSPM